MTIPEYAQSKGKSKQAIYQKLTASGIDKSLLLDEKGDLTEKGIQQLDLIMSKQRKKTVVHGKPDRVSTDDAKTALRAEIDRLQARVDELTADRDEWRELFKAENQKNETMTETVRQLSVDLAQAQALHATEKKRLLSSGDGETLFTRLFKRTK